jgi:hypothetical protein
MRQLLSKHAMPLPETEIQSRNLTLTGQSLPKPLGAIERSSFGNDFGEAIG